MAPTFPDFTTAETRLAAAGAPTVPSELHGVVCGLLCLGGQARAADWIDEQLASFDGGEAEVAAAGELLESMLAASWAAINGLEMEFAPLLPADDCDLADRVVALSLWCAGFISGLALGGWSDAPEGGHADDVREVVADLTAISNAGLDDEEAEDPEALETAFTELAEYVRVGAQLVFDSLAGAADDGPALPIH